MEQASYMSGVEAFLDDLASNRPTPGGGAAAALLGGIGSALTAMVANLTLGRKKYQEVQAEAEQLAQDALRLKNELLVCYQEDVEAYNQVSAAYVLPKEDDAQKALRRESIQKALKIATLAPYECAQKALKGLELAKNVAAIGNINALSDAGVAALALRAAVYAAGLNMRINLGSIKDQAFHKEYSELVAKLEGQADQTFAEVQAIIAPKI